MNNKFLQLKALKQIIDEKKSFQTVTHNYIIVSSVSFVKRFFEKMPE